MRVPRVETRRQKPRQTERGLPSATSTGTMSNRHKGELMSESLPMVQYGEPEIRLHGPIRHLWRCTMQHGPSPVSLCKRLPSNPFWHLGRLLLLLQSSKFSLLLRYNQELGPEVLSAELFPPPVAAAGNEKGRDRRINCQAPAIAKTYQAELSARLPPNDYYRQPNSLSNFNSILAERIWFHSQW